MAKTRSPPAWKRSGGGIRRMGGWCQTKKVTTPGELKRQLEKSGDHVALLIERNGQKIFVPVRVG